MIKELPQEFEGQFNCLGQNTKWCITFTISIEEDVIKFNKKGKENTKTISYRLQFIGCARFMASSL